MNKQVTIPIINKTLSSNSVNPASPKHGDVSHNITNNGFYIYESYSNKWIAVGKNDKMLDVIEHKEHQDENNNDAFDHGMSIVEPRSKPATEYVKLIRRCTDTHLNDANISQLMNNKTIVTELIKQSQSNTQQNLKSHLPSPSDADKFLDSFFF